MPSKGAIRSRIAFTTEVPSTGSDDNAARRMSRASSSIERPCKAACTRKRDLSSSSILRMVSVAMVHLHKVTNIVWIQTDLRQLLVIAVPNGVKGPKKAGTMEG